LSLPGELQPLHVEQFQQGEIDFLLSPMSSLTGIEWLIHFGEETWVARLEH
jgi:hypothetical protein